MNNFVHLHLHSTFSFQDGFGLPKQYVERCKEIGQPAMAITDHGNVSGHFKWYEECIKNGIKPILGCELYVAPDSSVSRYFHITVLAMNNEGYRNLLHLVTKSWQEGFIRKPTIKMEDVIKYQKGLIILSGCCSSEVCKLIESGNVDKAKEKLLFLKENIEHFYIEVMPWTFEPAMKSVSTLYDLAEETGIPLVATMDCHYVTKEQSTYQEILLCIQSNGQMDDPKRWKFDQTDFYLKTREEMEQSLNDINPLLNWKEALDNTVKISELIDFKFPTAAPISFPIPKEEKENQLRQMCLAGLKDKKLDGNQVYQDKMKYELDLIVQKNFIDYFLIITDLVNWAKNNDILVGPARGSSAGSLVCYLLRITEVDPIVHGLMFERFIDINREDLPDIDVDFEDAERPSIKRYLEDKYGKDRVGQLATYSTFKGKSIITDFGRIYNLPYLVDKKLKSIIIERSGGDSRASFTLEDTFKQFDLAKEYMKEYPFLSYAQGFEGQLRQMSSHASGIIVANEPLTNFCAIYQQKGEPVISMDYDDASKLGFTKFDILGLNTLTSVAKALALIKERTGKDIDIYNLPLEDPKVYEGFKDPKKLFGIFQFDGQSVNQVCRQISPSKFEELSAINALSRPGPMHGLDTELNEPITTVYIKRKNKELPFKTAHKLLEPITRETQGVIIYQEQVMKTMREIGNMSWKDTALIRKLISRSMGVERFNDFKVKFTAGATEKGLTLTEIDNIWSAICTFGSWAFNKSHSVSYSIISYWTMWLKVYYPIEYYSAMTSTMLSEDKIRKVIKEYLREGYKILPIDVNRSKRSFSIDGKNLRLGFAQIKGMGEKVAESIIAGQPYKSIDDFEERAKAGKSKINLLSKMGAFDSIGGTAKVAWTLFGNVNESKYEVSMSFEEKLKICPLAVDFNIAKAWKDFIAENIKWKISKIENLDPSANTQTIMGIVYDKNLKDKIEEALTRGKIPPPIKDGLSKYCNFILEDDTDFVTVRISPQNFQRLSKLIFEDIDDDSIVMVKGRMGDGIRMFFANEIICLNNLKEKLETKKPLNDSELILMGKKWLPLKRFNY
jgi:DNA polymerase-3 subunit alpha